MVQTEEPYDLADIPDEPGGDLRRVLVTRETPQEIAAVFEKDMTEPGEPRGAHDRRVWAAMARHKAGAAIELARLLLESAGWPPDYCGALLRDAASVDEVLAALRGSVRVVRSHEESHASEELRSLAQDLLRDKFPGQDVRDECFRAGKSGTSEIVAGLRRLLQGEGPDGLFPGRRPLPEGAAPVRYPVEDGPGASDMQRLEVLVMRGTRRSTVAVIDDRSGKSLHREIVEHADEATAAGRAVENAVRAWD